jgi:uncharacterized protein (TIGR03435 family)
MRITLSSNFGSGLAVNLAALLAISAPIALGRAHSNAILFQPQSNYKFEVASIKPDKSATTSNGLTRVRVNPAPDGFTASGVNLVQLISYAYGSPTSFSVLGAFNRDQLYFQKDPITRAPDWFRAERFDVDARMETSVADALQKLSPDDRYLARQQMLQSLLAERFKLTVHHETKELPVFALVIAKNGLKIRESKSGDAPSSGGGRGGAGSFEVKGRGGPIVAEGVPIATLVQFLSRQPLGRSVVDKTGLSGKYDFTLQWTPDDLQSTTSEGGPPLDSPWPSLFTALQEQLGLKLEPQKGPVQTLVVDHAEKPSGN